MKVAVVGASGYTGLELLRILLRHPQVELVAATSEQRAGLPVAQAFPSLGGLTDLVFEALDAGALAGRAELVFACLPHAASAPSVARLREAGVAVVDLSADFRLGDMATYEAAKARIFELQSADDAAIGFVDDSVVMRHLDDAPGRRRTFGSSDADYRLDGDALVGPAGPIAPTRAMRRSLPHDITNALAASALVLETGLAGPDAIAAALGAFEAPPHRLEPIGTWDGVEWFNDSKATTPHAAATAIRAFDSLVLIAGGSRKGVDLAPMAAEPDRVRAVVAIGEAAPDVRAVFESHAPVAEAESMDDAVELARLRAEAGDAVVLSPGCASFDWYSGYPERGDDFRRIVHEQHGSARADS